MAPWRAMLRAAALPTALRKRAEVCTPRRTTRQLAAVQVPPVSEAAAASG